LGSIVKAVFVLITLRDPAAERIGEPDDKLSHPGGKRAIFLGGTGGGFRQ